MSAVRVNPIRAVKEPARAKADHPRLLLLADPLLMVAALGLIACSLITLKGVTRTTNPGHPLYYVERQALYAAFGLAVAVALARFDYSRLHRLRYALFAVMVAANVLVFGTPTVLGAHRWFPLPLFQVQPSEFGKVLLICALGAFAAERARRLHQWRTTARIMVLSLAPAMIVIPQPDLGTGLVYVAIGFTILFVGGTPWKHLVVLVALFAVAVAGVLVIGPSMGVHVLKPYQVQRLTGFLHPSHDPANQTYNITQSLTAIGSGGKTGTGVAGATQAQLGYLPEKQTDFIFSVVGETYGFVGAAFLLSLYALLIWRSLRILTLAKNLYGTVIAGGILAMLMFQVFVNVGMTIGIMPITGVPLPLMSYGGSSVLVTCICLGLLQSIRIQARLTAGRKGRVVN
jgi:rod shape determining protein RodA